MYILTIQSIKTVTYTDGRQELRCAINLVDEENKIDEVRFLGFSLDSTDKQIKSELKKYVNNLNTEQASAVVEKEKLKVDNQINKTINKLEGIEIK